MTRQVKKIIIISRRPPVWTKAVEKYHMETGYETISGSKIILKRSNFTTQIQSTLLSYKQWICSVEKTPR